MTNITLFLDIDGVLNDHTKFDNGYCGIQQDKVKIFNSILDQEPIDIVISSAWRYLVHNGYMDVVGLENMLLTHGINCRGKICDITRKDFEPNELRENVIMDYIYKWNIKKYLVLDDLQLLLPNFYYVKNGLSSEDLVPIKQLIQKIANN